MSILNQARQDAALILGDAAGFGSSVLLKSSDGVVFRIVGIWNDTFRSIDPDSGLPIAARRVTLVLSDSAIEAAGVGIPTAVAELTAKPWIVTKGCQAYRVAAVEPDATLQAKTLVLESYHQ